MRLFLIVTTIHFIEHLIQIYQLYFLHLPRPECLGLIGLWQPWLMKSEALHYLFALFMLVGLYYLKDLNVWWRRAYYFQQYHHIEHLLLVFQMILGLERTGIGGLWFPRIELHFFYNLVVMLPIFVAMTKSNKLSGDSV